jgi:ligand-binding sensor domain-containing protein
VSVRGVIVTGLCLLIIGGGSISRAQWAPDEVITYASFDQVVAVSSSMTHAVFATNRGVIRYDKMMQRWEQPLTGSVGYPQEPIERVWVDRYDQTLVIATDLGLYEYDDFLGRWYMINELPVMESDVEHLRDLDVLLPEFDANYMGGGLFRDYFGRSFSTTDIVDDGSGNLWIGTWGYGPAKADRASGLMALLPYGLIQSRVDCIAVDDTVLWVGGIRTVDFRTGLTAFNPEANSFFRLETGISPDLPSEDIYCLEADSTALYAGTPYGLYTIDKTNYRARGPIDQRKGLAGDFVLALERADRSLYVGTDNGLSRVDLENDSLYRVRHETLGLHVIYDLEAVDNTIWIASSAGAFRYTPETDRLQQYQDPDQVLRGSVLNVEPDGDYLWLASDVGVVELDLKTGRNRSFHEPSDLRDGRPMAANGQIVALAADLGLTMIVHDLEKTRSVRISTADGLPSDNILALEMDGDYLWIGTDEGLTRFLWNHPRWVD